MRLGDANVSRPVAMWLFACAFVTFLMVLVGGMTRLTGSGLSITEWKPIMGALPPMNAADWAAAFEKYKAIPQYAQVNAGMSLGEFQGIFWWEWSHRLIGRLIGVIFFVPFVIFLVLKKIPRRLIWRCAVLLALGGLQGAIGWWMVSSGLSERVDVAPERLTVHLGLALIIFMMLIWTGLEAWNGVDRNRPNPGWSRAAAILLGAVFFQCLLGGLVAGAKAGFVYTDWPLMNGGIFPPVQWGKGALAFLHDQALVQFNHRIWAYVVLIGATIYGWRAWKGRLPDELGWMGIAVAVACWLQAFLGIATLMHATPLWLGGLHQAGACIVLTLATLNLWLVRRAQARLFSSNLGR